MCDVRRREHAKRDVLGTMCLRGMPVYPNDGSEVTEGCRPRSFNSALRGSEGAIFYRAFGAVPSATVMKRNFSPSRQSLQDDNCCSAACPHRTPTTARVTRRYRRGCGYNRVQATTRMTTRKAIPHGGRAQGLVFWYVSEGSDWHRWVTAWPMRNSSTNQVVPSYDRRMGQRGAHVVQCTCRGLAWCEGLASHELRAHRQV